MVRIGRQYMYSMYNKNLPFIFIAHTKITYSWMSVNYSYFLDRKKKRKKWSKNERGKLIGRC